MKQPSKSVFAAIAMAVLLAGCAQGPSVAELNALTDQIVKASFRDQGHVKIERITATDETNRLCSEADVLGKPLAEAVAKRIEAANLQTIKWPSDGKFLGDWKQGEAIAQSGRGLTWTDKPGDANGGNCYNCHQISQEEISYGTIGPSLYNYGKIRGVTDPNSAAETHRRVHLGQDLERQGLQRLFQHAPGRARGHFDRSPGASHRRAVARPQVTGQQMTGLSFPLARGERAEPVSESRSKHQRIRK